MSLAFGTLITTPAGTKAIEDFNDGDTAIAFTPNGEVPKPVIFSSGSGPHGRSMMMYLWGNDWQLIVTPDQPMILFNNTPKRADQLIPNMDKLLGANNQAIDLSGNSAGEYTRGMHHIAIDKQSPDGDHRIIANGIVCGDYSMEINMPRPEPWEEL